MVRTSVATTDKLDPHATSNGATQFLVLIRRHIVCTQAVRTDRHCPLINLNYKAYKDSNALRVKTQAIDHGASSAPLMSQFPWGSSTRSWPIQRFQLRWQSGQSKFHLYNTFIVENELLSSNLHTIQERFSPFLGFHRRSNLAINCHFDHGT